MTYLPYEPSATGPVQGQGRDDPEQAQGPSFDQVYAQLNDERVNRRAQRFLRDLRRDAVIDYR